MTPSASATSAPGALAVKSAVVSCKPAPIVNSGVPKRNAQSVFIYLVRQGATRQAAAGVFGNLNRETCGSFSPSVSSVGAMPSVGLVGWTNSRRVAMQSQARREGVAWTDLQFRRDIWCLS